MESKPHLTYDFIGIVLHLLMHSFLAQVISVAYGINEADVTLAYAVRQCNEYAKVCRKMKTHKSASADTRFSLFSSA